MGLAPNLVDQVLSAIRSLKDENLTILLVEQNALAALSIADRAYVMETGKITLGGTAAEIRSDPRVRTAYLGISKTVRDARPSAGTGSSWTEV